VRRSNRLHAKGLKEGIGCMPMETMEDDRWDRYGEEVFGYDECRMIEVNVGSFG